MVILWFVVAVICIVLIDSTKAETCGAHGETPTPFSCISPREFNSAKVDVHCNGECLESDCCKDGPVCTGIFTNDLETNHFTADCSNAVVPWPYYHAAVMPAGSLCDITSLAVGYVRGSVSCQRSENSDIAQYIVVPAVTICEDAMSELQADEDLNAAKQAHTGWDISACSATGVMEMLTLHNSGHARIHTSAACAVGHEPISEYSEFCATKGGRVVWYSLEIVACENEITISDIDFGCIPTADRCQTDKDLNQILATLRTSILPTSIEQTSSQLCSDAYNLKADACAYTMKSGTCGDIATRKSESDCNESTGTCSKAGASTDETTAAACANIGGTFATAGVYIEHAPNPVITQALRSECIASYTGAGDSKGFKESVIGPACAPFGWNQFDARTFICNADSECAQILGDMVRFIGNILFVLSPNLSPVSLLQNCTDNDLQTLAQLGDTTWEFIRIMRDKCEVCIPVFIMHLNLHQLTQICKFKCGRLFCYLLLTC